jgi:hypothetical protein
MGGATFWPNGDMYDWDGGPHAQEAQELRDSKYNPVDAFSTLICMLCSREGVGDCFSTINAMLACFDLDHPAQLSCWSL